MHSQRGRRNASSPQRESGCGRAVSLLALVLFLVPHAGALPQPVPSAPNTDAIVAALARATLTSPDQPAPDAAAPKPGRPAVTGQITFSPLFTGGNAPVYGTGANALDLTSSSRISVEQGRARLNLALVRPTTFGRAGQPDQFYSGELLYGRQALRVGDITPRFTDHTTGYARVHGVEAQLALGRLVQLNAVHGLSQRATQSEGSLFRTYRRTLTGARLALTPWRP